MRQRLLLATFLLAACAGPGTPPSAPPTPPASTPETVHSPSTSAPASSPPAPKQRIRVAHAFISAETLPIWVALETGLYGKYGLEVEAVPLQTSAQVAPAMASGEVQIALTTGSGVVEFDLSGGDHVIVAGYSNQMRYFLHARPDIARVEDLRGKRIGITRRGGAIDVAARIFLERHGLVYGRDAAIVELGTAQNQLNGLAAGVVDAAIVALPTNLLAERQGFPLIEDTKQHNVAFPTNVIAVRRPYLESQTDVVRRYLQAHIEAVEVIRSDKALAKRLLGRGTNTDDEDLLERSYQIYIQDLQDIPYPSAEAIQGALDAIALERPEARAAQPADFYDDRLVRELDQSGFIRGLWQTYRGQ
jgi:ABC-type nitrate/sulfonate/bicarbonate transport system substrate-binding protein